MDWSRESRKQLSLLKSEDGQTKLTDYFTLLDKIENIMQKNPELHKVVANVNSHRKPFLSNDCESDFFCPLFKQLLVNAYQNVNKIPTSRRHDTIIKKFATSLLIYAGPMAYDLVHRNMPTALPSLRTVQREVHNEYQTISEGYFQFDGLENYLTQHGMSSHKVVSISEDATRIIARIDYDSESDRLVGFVLPCNDQGLPLADSFLATTIESIEEMFENNKRSKYAYVYMAQCLSNNIPPYFLACLGTDNCFSATNVLNRWNYIYTECVKRNISVVSFGSDGDSRNLRAMKISCQFNLASSNDKSLFTKSPSILANEMHYPKDWSWFWVKNPTTIAFVQDTVHIAVKMKSRLLKPSTVLPMGNFMAGLHHLQILVESFPKEQHGIRYRDIDCRDKQNYEGVLRISSPTSLNILEQLPDGRGTLQYLYALRSFVDGFLDKRISVSTRIHKVWYTVFFLRYWRRWVKLNKAFTIKNNFITANAMTCIELNAHSLIIFIRILRDHIPNGKNYFLPWLLGSQPCESTFRAARSMTGTFSTIVNFSLLGFLQRLHRLQVQLQLETESSMTGITYPRVEKHLAKIGHEEVKDKVCLSDVGDDNIAAIIKEAKEEAIKAIKDLGMVVKGGKWEERGHKTRKTNHNNHKGSEGTAEKKDEDEDDDNDDSGADDDDDVDEDDDDNDEDDDNNKNGDEDGSDDDVDNDVCKCDAANNTESESEKMFLEDVYSTEETKAISADVTKLSNDGVIDEALCGKLKFEKVDSSTIPLYAAKPTEHNQKKEKKHSLYLEIDYKGKKIFIRKTTAVWLLQESEYVSSDRLFRVRSKQPSASQRNESTRASDVDASLPVVCSSIKVGEICIFKCTKTWHIGKVLQFKFTQGKTMKLQQYQGTSAKVETVGLSVLCLWYRWHPPLTIKTFSISWEEKQSFWPICTYICTLYFSCFHNILHQEGNRGAVVRCGGDDNNALLASAILFSLSDAAFSLVEELFLKDGHSREVVSISDRDKQAVQTGISTWRHYGCYVLTKQHKSQLYGDQLLDDIHIGAAQALIKKQHPEIGGLQNTLLQNSKNLQPFQGPNNLQIVHMGDINHWIVISTMGCKRDEIEIYDSLQTTLTVQSETIIARYLHSKSSYIIMKYINVAAQSGSTECGLYAIAIMTALAHGQDPALFILDQNSLRTHMGECFEAGYIQLFPVIKKRRIKERVKKEKILPIYCNCRLPEDDDMVQCDTCKEWYHFNCIGLSADDVSEGTNWDCQKCT